MNATQFLPIVNVAVHINFAKLIYNFKKLYPSDMIQIMILAVLLCSFMVYGMNYYEMLRVSRDASKSEIQNAYRTITLNTPPATTKVLGVGTYTKLVGEINVARDTLVDPRQRAMYDLQLDLENSLDNLSNEKTSHPGGRLHRNLQSKNDESPKDLERAEHSKAWKNDRRVARNLLGEPDEELDFLKMIKEIEIQAEKDKLIRQEKQRKDAESFREFQRKIDEEGLEERKRTEERSRKILKQ